MKFSQLQTIADTIAAGNAHDVPALIDSTLATIPQFHANRTKKERDFIGPLKKESAWHVNLRKLAAMIETGVPAFTIIAEGNGKLPFLAFSSLPGRGFCPGAGACLQFCYSFRAWRYPAAFCRQAQNAVLMQSEKGRAAILQELDTETARIKGGRKYKGGQVDFRLYVDGDYSDASHVEFWFNALHARPDLAAYGYSKSWAELLQHADTGGTMPANYLLNLSSGSVHGNGTRARVAQLPVTRGGFNAVNIGRKVKSSDHGTPAHNAELRAAYKAQTGRKAFTCPGKCGDCTPRGHACGSDRFRNIDIIIAVH